MIGAWLLQHPLAAVENRLACVILEGLNWGYAQVAINALVQTSSVLSSIYYSRSLVSPAGWLLGLVSISPQGSSTAGG